MNARHVTSTRHVFDPSIYTYLIPSPRPLPIRPIHEIGALDEYSGIWYNVDILARLFASFDERGQILNLSGVPLPKNTSIRPRATHINFESCVLKFCDG